MGRVLNWLDSDAQAAAYAFAGLVIGGTFFGVVAIAILTTALLDIVR